MSAIIEALMDNFVFVIIVIGIIASIFNRLKQAGSQEPRMPDFSGGMNPTHGEEYPRSTNHEEWEAAFDEPPERNDVSAHAYTGEAREDDDLMLGTGSSVYQPDQSIVNRPLVNRQQDEFGKKDSSEPIVSADDLTRAVVWAEILGPPRGRRPLRMRR